MRPSLPRFGEGVRTAAARVRRGYVSFLPGILSTWVLVEVVAPASGRPIVAIAPALFSLGLVGYAAAASRAAGRTDENVFWLTITRSSACLSSLGVLLVLGLVSAIFVGAALALGAGDEPRVLWICLGGWAVVTLLVCSRLWPAVVVPFLYGGATRYSPSGRGTLWVGPGLPTAWRMTSAPGVLFRVSLPYLLVVSLVAGAWGAGRGLLPESAAVRLALDAAFYSVGVPFLVTLADVLGDGLRVPTDWDDAATPSRAE